MKAKGRRGKGQSRRKRQKTRKPQKKKAAKKKSARAEFRFLDHPADIGFTARGDTLEALFAAASRAVCDYGWELGKVQPREKVAIDAKAASVEDLLYSWLSEILFLADAERWVFKEFSVERVAETDEAGEKRWTARGEGRGEKFDPERHRGKTYIKAITYHQLAVEKKNGRWHATIYLDV